MAHIDSDRLTNEILAAATSHYLAGESIDMSRLAVELGMSRATLYRRAGNSEELLGRVLERQTESTFRRVPIDPGMTGVEAVLHRLDGFMTAVLASGPLRALIARDPVLFVRVVIAPGPVERVATELVAELLREEIPGRLALEPEVLGRAIVRVCDSFMYSHLLNGSDPEVAAAGSIIRVLLGAPQQLRIAVERRAVDASESSELPVSKRGRRTRADLMSAANTVFARLGYHDARLVDITEAAGCSIGSFYTYFGGKDEIFAELLELTRDDMLHTVDEQNVDASPLSVIEAANRAYFESYRRHAGLMVALEQVAHVDGRFRGIRRDRSAAFVRRNAAGIADLQARGLADPTLDADAASRALSGMISRLAYSAFAYPDGEDGSGTPSVDELVETASRLWANALGISSAPTDFTTKI